MNGKKLVLLAAGGYLAVCLFSYLTIETFLFIGARYPSEGIGYLIGIPFVLAQWTLDFTVPESIRRKLFIDHRLASDRYRNLLLREIGSGLNALNARVDGRAITEYDYLIRSARRIVEDSNENLEMQMSAAEILHWRDLDDDYTTRLIIRHLTAGGVLRRKALDQTGHRRYHTPLMARILFDFLDHNIGEADEIRRVLKAFVCQDEEYLHFPSDVKERLESFRFECKSRQKTKPDTGGIPPHILRLINELGDANQYIRVRAIHALKHNDELAAPSVPRLSEMLRSSPDEYEQRQIVRALNRIRTSGALEAVAAWKGIDPVHHPSAKPSDWIEMPRQ